MAEEKFLLSSRRSLLYIAFFAIFLLSMILVLAAHIITPTTANVNEDVSTLYNITVNNTDTEATANITQVNVTLPPTFTFVADTNETSAGAHSFTNTSTVLSWLNESGLIMNLTSHTFFFNATASTPGTYNISVYTVNASGVFNTNISVTVNDTTSPNVTDLIPVNNTQFNITETIEIAANVSDNVNVSAVLANITLPNGTINQLILINTTAQIGNTKWNTTFTIPALLGTYNITFIANDTSNNINSSEKTNFTAVDRINPSVFQLRPVNNSIFNISESIEISANVTDSLAVGSILANITLPNGTVNQITLSNSSGFASKFNNSFTIPALLGTYNITFIANDTQGNLNTSERTNFTAQDLVFPTIQFVAPTESNNSFLSRNFILINVTANDSTLVNVTIRLFNATLSLINQTTTTSSPNFVNISGLSDGVYYFNATATDSTNNRNSTETRTATIDTTRPIITLISPANGVSATTDSYDFTFNSTDTNTISNCSLIIDGSIVGSLTSVNNTGGSNSISKSSLSVASHTWSINCTDIANNLANSSSRTFEVTASSTGGSGGGGSGGYPTYNAPSAQLESQNGYQVNAYENWKVSFKSQDNLQHTLRIDDISANYITITVSSTTQKANISIGETRKFELTGDNFYDLSVTLNSIINLARANITMKLLHESIAPLPSPQPSPEKEAVPAQPLSTEPTPQQKSILDAVIVIGIVLVVSVIVLAFIFKYRRRRKHYGFYL
jgi:hypothetical protein